MSSAHVQRSSLSRSCHGTTGSRQVHEPNRVATAGWSLSNQTHSGLDFVALSRRSSTGSSSALGESPTRSSFCWIGTTRLQHWVVSYEKKTILKSKIVSKNLIRFLEDALTAPPEFSVKVVEWSETSLPDLMDAKNQAVAWALVLTTFAPQTVYQSTYWYSLVEFVGVETARVLVVWWSLRHTLKGAQGLAF